MEPTKMEIQFQSYANAPKIFQSYNIKPYFPRRLNKNLYLEDNEDHSKGFNEAIKKSKGIQTENVLNDAYDEIIVHNRFRDGNQFKLIDSSMTSNRKLSVEIIQWKDWQSERKSSCKSFIPNQIYQEQLDAIAANSHHERICKESRKTTHEKGNDDNCSGASEKDSDGDSNTKKDGADNDKAGGNDKDGGDKEDGADDNASDKAGSNGKAGGNDGNIGGGASGGNNGRDNEGFDDANKDIDGNDDEDDSDTDEEEVTISEVIPTEDSEWKFVNKFKKYAECPRCSEFYNRSTKVPKLLPCGHNICGNCEGHKNKCDVCNETFSEQLFPDYGLMEHLDFILDNGLGTEDVSKSFVGSSDTFHSLLADSVNVSDDFFLAPIIKMETDLHARRNLISSVFNIYKEGAQKFEDMKKSQEKVLKKFSSGKNMLLESNSFSEIITNLESVRKRLENTKEIKDLDAILHKEVNEINNTIKNLLGEEKRTTVTLQSLRKKFSYKQFNCYLSTKCDDDSIKYAKLEYYFGFFLHTFTTNIPQENFIYSFEDVEKDLLKKENTLFMDIVHTDDGCGVNPNRIYAKMESDEKIRPILLMLMGLTSSGPLGINISDNKNFLLIERSQLIGFFSDEMMKDLVYKTMKPETGHIVIPSQDLTIKIIKKETNEKKKLYCVIGRVTSGIREFTKIKGNCYLQNCGLFVEHM